MEKFYFDGIKVGDKIWTIENGECVVGAVVNSITCFEAGGRWYYYDGILMGQGRRIQSAFWSNPNIIAPPKPKKKVEYACWVGLSHKNNCGARMCSIPFESEQQAKKCGWETVSRVVFEVEE